MPRPEPDFTEKGLLKFRDYSIDDNDPLRERVRRTYREMHLNQTVDFVKRECRQYFIKITYSYQHINYVYLSVKFIKHFSSN